MISFSNEEIRISLIAVGRCHPNALTWVKRDVENLS